MPLGASPILKSTRKPVIVRFKSKLAGWRGGNMSVSKKREIIE